MILRLKESHCTTCIHISQRARRRGNVDDRKNHVKDMEKQDFDAVDGRLT